MPVLFVWFLEAAVSGACGYGSKISRNLHVPENTASSTSNTSVKKYLVM